MIKVINLVSLLVAPILIQYKSSDPGVITAVVIFLILIIGSISISKRGGFRAREVSGSKF